LTIKSRRFIGVILMQKQLCINRQGAIFVVLP
jgi:hypothetical protein